MQYERKMMESNIVKKKEKKALFSIIFIGFLIFEILSFKLESKVQNRDLYGHKTVSLIHIHKNVFVAKQVCMRESLGVDGCLYMFVRLCVDVEAYI